MLEVKATIVTRAPRQKRINKRNALGDVPSVVPPTEEETMTESDVKKLAHTKAYCKYVHDSPLLKEKLIQGLTPRLGLILGEHYVIPFKLTSPSGGAPKGMEVELVDIILKDTAKPVWDRRRRHFSITASQVRCVIVQATLGEVSRKVLSRGMPPGVIAIAPNNQPCKIAFNGVTDTFHLNQVPLTPGFARTLHKVQGQKKNAVVVYPEAGTSGAFAYCGLSRCPTMAGTRLLTFLNDDPVFYKRSPEEIIDTIRLELLNVATRRSSLTAFGRFDDDDVEDLTEDAEVRLQLSMRTAKLQCDCVVANGPRKKKQKTGQLASGSTLAPRVIHDPKDPADPRASKGKKKVD
jgi:hypothetical protein